MPWRPGRWQGPGRRNLLGGERAGLKRAAHSHLSSRTAVFGSDACIGSDAGEAARPGGRRPGAAAASAYSPSNRAWPAGGARRKSMLSPTESKVPHASRHLPARPRGPGRGRHAALRGPRRHQLQDDAAGQPRRRLGHHRPGGRQGDAGGRRRRGHLREQGRRRRRDRPGAVRQLFQGRSDRADDHGRGDAGRHHHRQAAGRRCRRRRRWRA